MDRFVLCRALEPPVSRQAVAGPSQPWTTRGWRMQTSLTPFAYPDFTQECRQGMATAQSCRAASITIEMFTRSPR